MAQPNGVKPGERRGGRAKGTPNLDPARRTMREILTSLNHDAVRALVLQAQDEDTDPALRAKINLELVEYLYPKLKSIEIKDDSAGKSDFLMVREMLAAYRAWRREQGLPEIGALPDKPPTEPYQRRYLFDRPAQAGPPAHADAHDPAPPAPTTQTNGTARPPQRGDGKRAT